MNMCRSVHLRVKERVEEDPNIPEDCAGTLFTNVESKRKPSNRVATVQPFGAKAQNCLRVCGLRPASAGQDMACLPSLPCCGAADL